MAAEEDSELRDLVLNSLQNNGILAKIKAQIRASVYLTLDEENTLNDTPIYNEKLMKSIKSIETKLIFFLIKEFLEYFELQYTLNVLESEAQLKTNSFDEIKVKLKQLKFNMKSNEKPLLYNILETIENLQRNDTISFDNDKINEKEFLTPVTKIQILSNKNQNFDFDHNQVPLVENPEGASLNELNLELVQNEILTYENDIEENKNASIIIAQNKISSENIKDQNTEESSVSYNSSINVFQITSNEPYLETNLLNDQTSNFSSKLNINNHSNLASIDSLRKNLDDSVKASADNSISIKSEIEDIQSEINSEETQSDLNKTPEISDIEINVSLKNISKDVSDGSSTPHISDLDNNKNISEKYIDQCNDSNHISLDKIEKNESLSKESDTKDSFSSIIIEKISSDSEIQNSKIKSNSTNISKSIKNIEINDSNDFKLIRNGLNKEIRYKKENNDQEILKLQHDTINNVSKLDFNISFNENKDDFEKQFSALLDQNLKDNEKLEFKLENLNEKKNQLHLNLTKLLNPETNDKSNSDTSSNSKSLSMSNLLFEKDSKTQKLKEKEFSQQRDSDLECQNKLEEKYMEDESSPSSISESLSLKDINKIISSPIRNPRFEKEDIKFLELSPKISFDLPDSIESESNSKEYPPIFTNPQTSLDSKAQKSNFYFGNDAKTFKNVESKISNESLEKNNSEKQDSYLEKISDHNYENLNKTKQENSSSHSIKLNVSNCSDEPFRCLNNSEIVEEKDYFEKHNLDKVSSPPSLNENNIALPPLSNCDSDTLQDTSSIPEDIEELVEDEEELDNQNNVSFNLIDLNNSLSKINEENEESNGLSNGIDKDKKCNEKEDKNLFNLLEKNDSDNCKHFNRNSNESLSHNSNDNLSDSLNTSSERKSFSDLLKIKDPKLYKQELQKFHSDSKYQKAKMREELELLRKKRQDFLETGERE